MNHEDEDKSYIDILKEASKDLSDLVLPSMGIIDNEKVIDVDIEDYLKKDNDE